MENEPIQPINKTTSKLGIILGILSLVFVLVSSVAQNDSYTDIASILGAMYILIGITMLMLGSGFIGLVSRLTKSESGQKIAPMLLELFVAAFKVVLLGLVVFMILSFFGSDF